MAWRAALWLYFGSSQSAKKDLSHPACTLSIIIISQSFSTLTPPLPQMMTLYSVLGLPRYHIIARLPPFSSPLAMALPRRSTRLSARICDEAGITSHRNEQNTVSTSVFNRNEC